MIAELFYRHPGREYNIVLVTMHCLFSLNGEMIDFKIVQRLDK